MNTVAVETQGLRPGDVVLTESVEDILNAQSVANS